MRRPARLSLLHPVDWQMVGTGAARQPVSQFDFKNDPQLIDLKTGQAIAELAPGPAAGGYTVRHPAYMELEIGPSNVKSCSWYHAPDTEKKR